MSMQYCPKICLYSALAYLLYLLKEQGDLKKLVFLAVAGSGSIPTPLLAKTGKASTYAKRKYSEWEEAILIADEWMGGGGTTISVPSK